MKAKKIRLLTPTNELVDRYVNKFNNDDQYFRADVAIRMLFKKFPDNTTIEEVLLKASIINTLYSANIYNIYEMAKHICKLQIDPCFASSDTSVVHKIANEHRILKSNKVDARNFYSFATCNSQYLI